MWKLVLEQQLISDEITKRILVAFNYMKFPVDKLSVQQTVKDGKPNTVATIKFVKVKGRRPE